MLHFAKDVATGIRAVQAQGFAHCDIKRANILIDFDSDTDQYFAVLTYFGLAQVVTDKQMLVKQIIVL